MAFTRLAMEHFRLFRSRVELPLREQGLVLVRGRNLVSEACGDNGVGKTGIVHALSYVCFGEDLDGQKADDVACEHTAEPCRVELELDSGEVIVRGRRPKVLEIRGRGRKPAADDDREVQAEALQLLGFGVETFRNVLVLGQGMFDRFARADGPERMRVFSEVQGLDFRKAFKAAGDWRKTWALQASDHERKLVGLRARRGELAENVNALRERKALFKQERAAERAAFARRIADAVAAVKEADAAVQRSAKLRKHAETLRGRWERAAQMEDALSDLRTRAALAAYEHGRAKMKREALEAQLAEGFAAGECPSCLADLRGQAAQRALAARFEPRIRHARLEESKAEAVWKKLERDLGAGERGAATERGDLTLSALAEAEASCSQSVLAEQQRALASAKQALLRVKEEAKAAGRWDGDEQLAAAEAGLDELDGEIAAVETAQARAGRTVAAADYLIEAFGDRGIALDVLRENAGYLNERLAAHLEALTVGEASARIVPEVALKKGGVREGIGFEMAWSWGAGSYKRASEGQRARGDHAVFFAFQDLAESRCARPLPLKVWDEPEKHLDERGREMFCPWVMAEARRRGTGLLITHSPELAALIEPDHTWTVVLDRDGARVEAD